MVKIKKILGMDGVSICFWNGTMLMLFFFLLFAGSIDVHKRPIFIVCWIKQIAHRPHTTDGAYAVHSNKNILHFLLLEKLHILIFVSVSIIQYNFIFSKRDGIQ